jgi:hypothetical protein
VAEGGDKASTVFSSHKQHSSQKNTLKVGKNLFEEDNDATH